MTIQEKILQDKWLECIYHMDRMKDKWFEIQTDGAKKNIISREFKYEFNSFVNSCRSVTFVIQKCFKNKVEGFDDWYQGVQDALKQNDFAKVLVDIRNTNQKEGNRFPDIIDVKTINKYFQSETTYSPFPIEGNNLLSRLNLSEEEKKTISPNISNFDIVPILENFDINLVYDNKPEETYEEIKKNMEKMLIQETFKMISQKISEITDDEFKNSSKAPSKLKINEKIYTWDEFYDECKKLISFLKDNCINCIQLFT
ncbi:hypothetical protein [Chryseobacterium sp. MMS23-Vi53]|uniref:hypothetical protein n=1 Tax=Chryseobacterium sp. MMS23-Vi53 TaxID=3386644 RepID=UPI0039EABDC3